MVDATKSFVNKRVPSFACPSTLAFVSPSFPWSFPFLPFFALAFAFALASLSLLLLELLDELLLSESDELLSLSLLSDSEDEELRRREGSQGFGGDTGAGTAACVGREATGRCEAEQRRGEATCWLRPRAIAHLLSLSEDDEESDELLTRFFFFGPSASCGEEPPVSTTGISELVAGQELAGAGYGQLWACEHGAAPRGGSATPL